MESTHYQQQTDHALMTSTARGDMAAFEILYQRFATKIYHYILSSIRDDSTAQDLLAEILVAIWKGAPTFKGDSQVSTWIFGIVRHKVLDAIRQRTRHRIGNVPLDQALEIVDPGENPEQQAEQKDDAHLVKEAMGALSPEHQEVLYLAFYEELSYQEIATLTGVPVNTVKTRVFYAKQQLKRVLETRHQHEKLP